MAIYMYSFTETFVLVIIKYSVGKHVSKIILWGEFIMGIVR